MMLFLLKYLKNQTPFPQVYYNEIETMLQDL